MAPLVHMVFRQSRTVRDVIVTSCMLDLAQEDVSIALDLGTARLEGLLRAGVTRTGAALFGWYRGNWPARFAPLLTRATLAEVAWFALPMCAVAGGCAWFIGFEMHGL